MNPSPPSTSHGRSPKVRTQLGMFAKFWTPGQVKTRLATSIGEVAAAEFHQACVLTMLDRFRLVAEQRVLVYSPPEQRVAFEQVTDAAWNLRPQSPGDLGARMATYFDESFSSGAECVALMGSDSPTLPCERVHATWRLLENHEVVLGPSDDGGYYLVAARQRTPPIFDGIEWGSSIVWSQTIARLEAANVSWASLPQWYDVDEVVDLRRLAEELSGPLRDDDAFDRLRRWS